MTAVPSLVIEVVEAAERTAPGRSDDLAEWGGYDDAPTPLTDAEFRRHDQVLDELWRARRGAPGRAPTSSLAAENG